MTIQIEDCGILDYKTAWDKQLSYFEPLVALKKEKQSTENQPDYLILVEHPHVYTLGKSGDSHNLLINEAFLNSIGATYYHIERGGDITYHGPGQLVGYPILDLERLGWSLKQYIFNLEQAVIETIAEFGIYGERLNGASGVWLAPNETQNWRKICAIGVKVSRYITMHGFALNVNTDLNYFSYINPCGFTDKGVTSIQKETSKSIDMKIVKDLFFEKFGKMLI